MSVLFLDEYKLGNFAEATAAKKNSKPKHFRKKFHEAQAGTRVLSQFEIATVRQVHEHNSS